VDALQVFTEHVNQMSHWIHQAEFIRETRGVLGDADVKMAVEQSVGKDGLGDLQRHLDAITRNGVTRAGDVAGFNKLVQHLTSGVAVGAMAFNMHSVAVQGDSALRWMAAIPIQRWWRPLMVGQWMPLIPQIWNSETIQQRVVGGSDPVSQFALKRNAMTPARLLNLVHWSFWAMTHFDGAATAFSSAIVLSDAMRETDPATGAKLTMEQALEKMDHAVGAFSQPTLVSTKSQSLASAGPMAKMLLMFAADPMLKTAIMGEAIFKDIGRDGNWEKGIRKVIAVEVWSLVSQSILNAWAHATGADDKDPDKDEPWLIRHWIRALCLAPFQGLFVLGNVTEALISAATGERFFPRGTAIGSVAADMNKVATHWDQLMGLNFDDPKFWKEVDGVLHLLSEAAGGAPAAAYGAVHHIKGAYDVIEGNP
jgi:hypothetical protein